MRINMHAAKTNLSKIIAQLEEDGGEALICRSGRPVASIKAAPKATKKIGGQLKGQIWLADDFDRPDGTLFGIK